MRRRPQSLLAILAFSAACSSGSTPPPPPPAVVAAPLPSAQDVASRDLTADEQIRQAIDRLSFGARPGEYDSVKAIGVDRWIAIQLDPGRIPDREADKFVEQFPTLGQSAQTLLADYPPPKAEKKKEGQPMTAADSQALKAMAAKARRLVGDLQAAKVGRAVVSERQLNEVMVDFWFNHFNVYAAKGPARYYLAEYEREAIRPYALGKFRDLLGAVAHSPAMLFYLDNWESRANADEPTLASQQHYGGGRRGMRAPPPYPPQSRAPANGAKRQAQGLNENYARELLELHTLGVDGGYTQNDVINVARAFTGWSIEKPQQVGTFVFRPEWHDAGAKEILGRNFPAGHGMDEGEHVLNLLAHEPHTAQHIARQLVIRFVSDSPPPELVSRAENTFMETGGDIRETVRVIVTSQEFFSRAAYKNKVKSPLRLVASALRAVDAAPDTSPRTAQIVARLGEPLYLHQAPNGYPLTGESWINTGAILNRINFGLAVAAGHVPNASIATWPQGVTLSSEPREKQVDGAIALLLGGESSPDTRRILENGKNPMAAAAPTTNVQQVALADSLDFLPDPDAMTPPKRQLGGGGGAKRTGVGRGYDPLAQPADLQGFAQIVGLALGAPEFQRY